MDEWRISVVVDHAQRLGRDGTSNRQSRSSMVCAYGIGFRIGGYALIIGEEHAEISHAHSHVSDASDGLWQPWTHGDDVSLTGAEDGHGR